MANFVSQVKLPNNTTYTIRDPNARPLSNNDFDTINVTELNAGDVIVTGGARFLNTINGDISGNSATATSATSATKATQDESGNNIKSTYANAISISGHTITLKNKNGTSLGTVTVPDNNTTYTVATGTANGNIKVTPSSGDAYEVPVYGLKSAAYKNVTDTYSATGTDPVSGKAVAAAIDALPEPMVFKGSLGTGGTITTLPVDGTAKVGDTYKVITAGTYASKAAKVGDTFICLTKTSSANTWELIPSGDEPAGTVTSVAVANGGGLSVSGSPITSSGTITISHADTSSQASVNNSGRTYIQDITLDTYGHVTGITSATETVVNTDRYVNSAAFADATSADANNPVKMTLTRAGSDTASVTAYIPKVSSSSAGVAPKGAAVSSQSQTTKFLREDGTWAAPSYTTNTNTTYSLSASGESVVLSGSDNSSKSVSLGTQLLPNLPIWTADPTDDVYLIRRDTAGSAAYGQVKFSTVWNYIKSKTDPLYFMYRGKTTTASDPTLFTSIGTKQYNGVLPDGLTGQYSWGQAISIAGENARFDMYVSHQASSTNHSYGICYRSGWDNDKRPWQTILDSNNYTAYTVKKDGTGATGTWSLNTYEANLQWGGKNFSASYGCLDAALMDELGANRLQFIKADAITVEYTRDGGTTWTDYGATDAQKKQIFAQGGGLVIGKADSTNKATEHPGLYQLRITIDTGVAGIYTYLNKFIILVSSTGSANCMCKIQKALQSTPTAFVDHTDWIPIGGWSGYNVLNVASFTTYGNSPSSQYGRVRFVFKDGEGGSTSYNGLSVHQIKGFGGVGWITPSTMAKTGHIYSYNENQDAIFSNMVQANYLKATTKMTVSSGKITQLTSGHTMLFADGIGISNPTTANDVGWIRVLGTGESDTIMEIATGDDGGAGEQIVVRQYNTSSTVVNEATLLDKSGNTTFPKNVTATKFIGALQGNADTASKLGSSNVGSATQPIYLNGGTATACTYTLGKSVPSDAVFTDKYHTSGSWSGLTYTATANGGAGTLALTLPTGTTSTTVARGDHTHSSIKTEGDNRSVATTPNDYVDKLMFRGIKTASVIDSPGGTSSYSYLLGLRGWGDSSGGDAHELAFNNNGVYYRHGATTTWGDWSKIFTSADTYTGTLTSSQVTTALGFTPTANTGTITSVKTTAGTHTTINVSSGAANFNVPTKTSHLTNDSGYVTTDTKNTAGSTDTSSKIYLIGATSQAANPQTYSQDTAYVGTDGCLYSGGSKVLTAHQDISGKVSKSGDTMTGCLSITSANSSWAEGIRINRGNGGYCSFTMGGAANSTSGTGDNVWWLGCNPSSYSHKWFVAHNGSTQTGTYFYVDSSTQQSPHFRVGGDLAVGSKTTMSKTCTLRYNDSTLSLDFIFTT